MNLLQTSLIQKKIRDNSKDFDEFQTKIKNRGTPDYVRGKRLGKDIWNSNLGYMREIMTDSPSQRKLLDVLHDGNETNGIKHHFNYDWTDKNGKKREIQEDWY